MFKFPNDLYTDIRVEDVTRTNIYYKNNKVKNNTDSNEKGAFIRVFDGKLWYYGATTNVSFDGIQQKIDELAQLAVPNKEIYNNDIVKNMETNIEELYIYKDRELSSIPNIKKVKLLESYLPLFNRFKEIEAMELSYIDTVINKEIITSKGTHVRYDNQWCSIVSNYTISVDERTEKWKENIFSTTFDDLYGKYDDFTKKIIKDIYFTQNYTPVKKGVYECIFSPKVSGVFVHESFGHKSEADFIIGDKTLLDKWKIGCKFGKSILNIIDDGNIEGSGYVPYDDEGNRAKKTYLIQNGILKSRLNNSYTAGILKENNTSNARAVNFQYEPIVRMTTTYISAGNLSKAELFSGVDNGIYIEDYRFGSGMCGESFTITPSRAYMIRNGKIAEPIKVSIVSGSLGITLNNINGLSDEVKIISSATGGCGKMEQYGLPVAMGGPYVRVEKVNIE